MNARWFFKSLVWILSFPLYSMVSLLSADPFTPKIVTDDLDYPWGMAFIDEQTVLITEKSGQLIKLTLENTSKGTKTTQKIEVLNVPQVAYRGQGGLLDVALDPHFTDNQKIYLSYSKSVDDGYTTAVASGHLVDNRLLNIKTILVAKAESSNTRHFGSRLVFDDQGMLYVTVGDRGHRHRAQDLSSHMGKVLRVLPNGAVPKDNPFIGQSGVLPEIYSYGHRNPQGMIFDPDGKKVWIHEHGPRGGDEINLVIPAANFGWPVITYGREYSGFSITDETQRPGMRQPLWYWDPSIAPSGFALYRGSRYPTLKEDFLVGSLKFRLLTHLEINDFSRITDGHLQKNVTAMEQIQEHSYLSDLGERIRDVEVSPEGYLYVLTDSSNGKLIKLMP